MIDGVVDGGGFVNRERVLDEMGDQVERVIPWLIDREEWGTSPRAVAGQRAMLDLIGGPAPPRKEAEPT